MCAPSLHAAKEALLIANADYAHFGKLPNPLPDARQLSASLQRIGFTVNLVENANREQMLDALGAFEERLKASRGIAFFHYGGHGVQVNGRNYLIPADADIPDENRVSTRAVDVDEVMGSLDASGSRVNVVILDACRDNPLPATSTRSATRGLSIIAQKPRNSIIIYAAEAGSKAFDGLFTPALAKALTFPERPISELMTEVRREVYEKSGGSQTPGEYSQLFEQIFLGLAPLDNRQSPENSPSTVSESSSASVTSQGSTRSIPVSGSAALAETVSFELKLAGKSVGFSKAPAGALVKVKELDGEKVLVQHGGSEPVWLEKSQLIRLETSPVEKLEDSTVKVATSPPQEVEASESPTAKGSERFKSNILQGAQKEGIVELGPGKHQLNGEYSVGKGQKLVIAAGAEIIAGRDGGISVSGGTLAVEGTSEAPVNFKGASGSPGYWSGLKFNAASSIDISNARIFDADIGITLSSCNKSYITKSLIAFCNIGVLLQNRTKVTFEDCLITSNRGSGIRDNLSEPVLIKTTVSNNKEWGYYCEYYGSPRFDSCVISGNKIGGIKGAIYDAFSEAHNSVIDRNGRLDVEHNGTKDWEYTACWWGESNTKRLLSDGENANLRSIQDQLDNPKVARVRLDNFLEEKPLNVGSSIPTPKR
jgi:uncharacterized caspase-like protein